MAAIIAITKAKEKPAAPTLTLPLDALSADGVEPEVGDTVEHSIKGTVKSIKGDNAVISVTALDGQPVEGSPAEEAGESPEEEASEEECEGGGGPAGGGPSGAGGPTRRDLAAMQLGAANPLAAAAQVGRAKQRAATAALGNALRRRARGAPMPMM